MNDQPDDELAGLLRDAFEAKARAAVPGQSPPPPRFASATSTRSHRRRLWAPLLTAAAVAVVAGGVVVATTADDGGHDRGHGGHRTQQVAGPPPASSSATAREVPAATGAKPVQFALQLSDGSRVGVGMPVVARFSRAFTDARPLAAATTVTVDGKPADARWYFENSPDRSHPVEGHLRPREYWPAHAHVHVAVAARGLSAGKKLGFRQNVTVDFTTGPAVVATVDDATHRMTVFKDGRRVAEYPVSLGADETPTTRGIKVIMQKGKDVCMHGPGYHKCGIKDTQQLTFGGEYLHAAPWNTANIARGVDSSNGCTNLSPSDANALYRLTEVGDIVSFPNADGPKMRMDSGLGDWNVAWSSWRTGGLIRTS